LHSNNSFVVIIDENDKVVCRQRQPNDLDVIVAALEPYREDLIGVVVESTFNWYWLVDGLEDSGFRVHLANTTAIHQYSGLKYADDSTDARWLAHLLRLDVLPTGYVYPREQRALRDLLRKRISLVQLRTSNKLSLQNLSQRNLGRRFSSSELKSLNTEAIQERLDDGNLVLAMDSTLQVMACLDQEIQRLEREIRVQTRPHRAFALLKSVCGVGNILAQTILLETGEIGRFPSVGNYASYCRCVGSQRLTNHKSKGKGNTKNGNRYLAWAYVEAANFAIRYYPEIKRYYQRKAARTHRIVALKTVAHKLARASYYVMRDLQPFELKRAFG
jgi:transposase